MDIEEQKGLVFGWRTVQTQRIAVFCTLWDFHNVVFFEIIQKTVTSWARWMVGTRSWK